MYEYNAYEVIQVRVGAQPRIAPEGQRCGGSVTIKTAFRGSCSILGKREVNVTTAIVTRPELIVIPGPDLIYVND